MNKINNKKTLDITALSFACLSINILIYDFLLIGIKTQYIFIASVYFSIFCFITTYFTVNGIIKIINKR